MCQRKPCVVCPAPAVLCSTPAKLLQRRNPPSQRSSTSGSISRRLRSSSPPPIAKSAEASSPANPITLRSTWLRQRGCTLVASLFYSTCYIYGIIRFMPLVVSHSSVLPLIPKSHQFCPSHFDPLMLLPFDRFTVSLKTS